MGTRKDRLNEVYEYLHDNCGVHTKTDFAVALDIKRPGLYSAMNGNEMYLTNSLFVKINKAFPNIFNLDYLLTGNGNLLLVQNQQNTTLEVGAENLINLAAKLIKENEQLHRELKDTLTALRAEIANLKNTSQPKRYITTDMDMLNESSQTDTFNQ